MQVLVTSSVTNLVITVIDGVELFRGLGTRLISAQLMSAESASRGQDVVGLQRA